MFCTWPFYMVDFTLKVIKKSLFRPKKAILTTYLPDKRLIDLVMVMMVFIFSKNDCLY